MRALLDTHILLWALTDDVRLSPAARSIIADGSNAIFYSVASLWEVSIKHAAHPDRMMMDASQLSHFCRDAGFDPLSISERHVLTLDTLSRPAEAPPHNDPFDRIMLAQAKADNLIFLTHDSLIPHYNEPCILAV